MGNGRFSVKSLYEVLHQSHITASFLWLWMLKLPQKISHFIWLLEHNRLPTTSYLHHLNIVHSPTYALCHSGDETIPHLFFNCQAARVLWTQLKISPPLIPLMQNYSDPNPWLRKFILDTHDAPSQALPSPVLIPFCLWHIWKTRNNIFEKTNMSALIQFCILLKNFFTLAKNVESNPKKKFPCMLNGNLPI